MLYRVSRVLVGLLLLGVLPVMGQEGPEASNLKQLEEEYNKKENSDTINKLRRGDSTGDVGIQAHLDAMNVLARYTLFRFHDTEVHDPNPAPGKKSIATIYKDFEIDMLLLTKTPAKTSGTWPVYTRAMITQGKLALNASKPITRINAARCLARLPELEQPELLDFYTDVLNDAGQIDAVKYFILRGTTDLLAIPKEGLLNKDSVDKSVKALLAVVNRPGDFLPGTAETEKEGFRVLRREAIRGLAASRLPKLADGTKLGLVLLKAMNEGKTFAPPARMDEQIEAAIGLARINPDLDKDYCPDFAANEVGSFVLGFKDFMLGENKMAKLPCKVHAVRLLEALELLDAASAKQPGPVAAHVSKIKNLAFPILRQLQGDNPSPTQLTNLSKGLEAAVMTGGPNKSLYKGGS